MRQWALLLLLAGLTASAWAGQCCYVADADSGELSFSGIAEGSPFTGYFEEFSVRVCMSGRDPATAEIEVRVATGSADVGNRDGNEALRDEEFFAVERFPEANWQSSKIRTDNGVFTAQGQLSLRDITAEQEVALNFEENENGFRLTGGAEIMRLDWDVGTGEFEDTEFIRNRVDLEFDLDLRRR